MDNRILADNIKHLREAFKETQEYLAKNICLVDRTLVTKWEKCIREPTPDSIKRMADHYGVDPTDLVTKPLHIEFDWKTGKLEITAGSWAENEAENAFLESVDMTPYLFQIRNCENGDTIQHTLILPRLGIGKLKAYEIYKRAYLLDTEIDTDLGDERMAQVLEDYWYAYDNGIEDAGVNLLRIIFLCAFPYTEEKSAIIQQLKALIGDLKLTNNPAADYYEALCLQWGLFTQVPNLKAGAEMINELAQNMNTYAISAQDFLLEDYD